MIHQILVIFKKLKTPSSDPTRGFGSFGEPK
jgi:hypothetical protein